MHAKSTTKGLCVDMADVGYIYNSVIAPPPEDVQEALNSLVFYIDEGMNLMARWVGEAENPFGYYLNEDYDLIIGV